MGFVGEEDVLVRLVGLGLLGTILHQHMAVEGTMGTIVEDTFEELPAVAVGKGMVDKDVVVHLLFLVVEIEAVGFHFAMFTQHSNLGVVADVATVEGEGHATERSPLLHGDIGVVEQTSLVVEVLHLIVFHMGSFHHVYFGHVVGESGGVVVGVVAMEDDDMAVASHHHQVSCLEEKAVTGIDDRL